MEEKYIIGYKNSLGGEYFDVYVQEMHSYLYVFRDRIFKEDFEDALNKLKAMYKNNHVCFFKIY